MAIMNLSDKQSLIKVCENVVGSLKRDRKESITNEWYHWILKNESKIVIHKEIREKYKHVKGDNKRLRIIFAYIDDELKRSR